MTKKRYYVEEGFIPPYVPHPGEILKDELIAREITQQKFANMIKRPLKTVSLIINGKKSITVETAYDLEKAFGVRAEFWLGMQSDHDLFLCKKRREQNEKRISDAKLVDVPVFGMASCGEALAFAEEYEIDRIRYPLKERNVKDFFAVKAIGKSMNKATINGKGIDDGDYVIIKKEIKNPENGNYVLSIIDDKANIKKFFEDKKNKQILLVSESSENIDPIYIKKKDSDRYSICGVVYDVVKR